MCLGQWNTFPFWFFGTSECGKGKKAVRKVLRSANANEVWWFGASSFLGSLVCLGLLLLCLAWGGEGEEAEKWEWSLIIKYCAHFLLCFAFSLLPFLLLFYYLTKIRACLDYYDLWRWESWIIFLWFSLLYLRSFSPAKLCEESSTSHSTAEWKWGTLEWNSLEKQKCVLL